MRLRQRGQNVIEFGTGIAAVAFVALIGFTALGNAQQTYWGVVSNSPAMAAPTPAPHDFLHTTKTDINCGSKTTYLTGDTLTCTAIVTDTFNKDLNPPLGDVDWFLDSQILKCPLVPIAGQPASTCQLSYTWTATDAAKGTPHPLSAKYCDPNAPASCTPLSNHLSSTAPQTYQFNVHPPYQYAFTCKNPWPTSLPPNTVEVGQPLFCSLVVTDNVTHNPPPDGYSVTVSADAGAGFPYFACFTDDDPNPGSQHNTAFARMTIPGCVPQVGQSFTCTIIPGTNGLCANANAYSSVVTNVLVNNVPTVLCPAPTCSFVYRRNYDDNGVSPGTNYLVTDHLTALGAGETQITSLNVSPAISIVSIARSIPATATSVQCGGAKDTDHITVRGGQINTDTKMQSTTQQLAFSCSVSVTDIGPNTAFDFSGCIQPYDIHCDIDAEQPHSPLGTVTLSVLDSQKNPTGKTYTCTGSGTLGHVPPPPTYVANLHPLGAWFESSWCNTQTMTFPIGTWYLHVSYGGSAEHAATGASGGPATPDLEIDVS